MRRNDAEVLRKLTKSENCSNGGKGGDDDDSNGMLVLSKEKTLRVVRGLMALLLNMDFTCNVDLFLVTCKVSTSLALKSSLNLIHAYLQWKLLWLFFETCGKPFLLPNKGNQN